MCHKSKIRSGKTIRYKAEKAETPKHANAIPYKRSKYKDYRDYED